MKTTITIVQWDWEWHSHQPEFLADSSNPAIWGCHFSSRMQFQKKPYHQPNLSKYPKIKEEKINISLVILSIFNSFFLLEFVLDICIMEDEILLMARY